MGDHFSTSQKISVPPCLRAQIPSAPPAPSARENLILQMKISRRERSGRRGDFCDVTPHSPCLRASARKYPLRFSATSARENKFCDVTPISPCLRAQIPFSSAHECAQSPLTLSCPRVGPNSPIKSCAINTPLNPVGRISPRFIT